MGPAIGRAAARPVLPGVADEALGEAELTDVEDLPGPDRRAPDDQLEPAVVGGRRPQVGQAGGEGVGVEGFEGDSVLPDASFADGGAR